MENEYSLTEKKYGKKVPDKKYTRRVYSNEEINTILKDYIEVSQRKFFTLKPGNTKVCYIRSDGSFCYGGFINVNPIEKNDGSEVYMQLRGNIRKTNKNNVVWLIPYSSIKKLWVLVGPEYEFIREEIKKVDRRQREELAKVVDKLVEHIRKLKKEHKKIIRRLSNEEDTISVNSSKTNFTDFTTLKIYDD